MNPSPDSPQPGPNAPESAPASGFRRLMVGRSPRKTLVRILVLLAVTFGLFKWVLLPVSVDGISMEPTYHDHSIHVVNRLAYLRRPPARGDVVGIRVGGANHLGRTPSVMYMKRVVGLPGEQIAFAKGRVLINGVPLPEPYLNEVCDWTHAPMDIEPDHYFVVGDNRTMPYDLHFKGRIDRLQIVGKVIF